MRLPMDVTGLTIDPVNNAPIVVLREKDGDRILPIWIGVIEASAIAFELEQVRLNRPMTHDLLRAVIEALGARVERVAIVDLREGTYYATITLTRGEEAIEVDARPSDGIALALRAKCPILCEETVLATAHLKQGEWEARRAQAAQAPAEAPATEEEDRGEGGPKPIVEPTKDSLAELLENLSPEDFGKYKM
jgi:hypothetical protein